MSRLLPPLFVLVVWLALWDDVSAANVASGILVVTLIGLIIRPVPRQHTLHLFAIVRLLGVFVWRLVSSSAVVVLAVLAPTPARLRSGVVGVPLSHHSQLVATIVSDAISLTPGTLTLEARYADSDADDDLSPDGHPPVLYIHVLGLDDPEAIRADVKRLEELVVSAVTPSEQAPVQKPDGSSGSSDADPPRTTEDDPR
ncbi:MAG: Na+/H+ antiporter subunit E [Microthrixaceae bacterium]